MNVRLNPSRSKTENPSHKLNNALFATHRINICITTMGKKDPNCSARSAHQLLQPTIVIKEQLKPNTIVPIATAPYSAGEPVLMSLCTNAATTTAHIESMHSNNSTPQNKISGYRNLLNSKSITFTANTCSKPKSSSPLHHSSLPSTSEKFTTHQTF